MGMICGYDENGVFSSREATNEDFETIRKQLRLDRANEAVAEYRRLKAKEAWLKKEVEEAEKLMKITELETK